MSDVEELISRYVNEGLQHRARMQAKLFTLFTETTGYRPEDLCLVEQQIKKGIHEYTSIYYFDWKHRHQTMEPQSSLQSQLKEAEEKLKIAVEALESIATYKVTEAACSGVDQEAGVMNFTVGQEVELYDERAELARVALYKIKGSL